MVWYSGMRFWLFVSGFTICNLDTNVSYYIHTNPHKNMEINSAYSLAIDLMANPKHDLLSKGWSFRFDRAKRRFGCCFYSRKEITLSLELVKLNSEDEIRNTILHEIAHALVGKGHGHNWVWKMKAKEIGCTAERCYSSDKVNCVKGKYVAVCVGCGKEHYKHRKPRRTSSCGKCSGGSYNEKYKLNWKIN